MSLVFCLLFQTLVIKNVFKRLLDLRYYYSGICHGSESFDCVLCFRSFWSRFYEIDRSITVLTSLVSCHQVLFASLKHREGNCFQNSN